MNDENQIGVSHGQERKSGQGIVVGDTLAQKGFSTDGRLKPTAENRRRQLDNFRTSARGGVRHSQPRRSFGQASIEVGLFLIKHRQAGNHFVVAMEAVHEAFPGLSFFDFMGGFILADCIESNTISVRTVGDAS